MADLSKSFDPNLPASNSDAASSALVKVSDAYSKADINNLTVDASPNGAADYVATYDASASAHKKVLLNNLPVGAITNLEGGKSDSSYAAVGLSPIDGGDST